MTAGFSLQSPAHLLLMSRTEVSSMKKTLTIFLLLMFFAALMPYSSQAADQIQPKKKGHM